MALIKDGKVYRTVEEQLLHLTEKHLEQVSFNENVSKKLQELTVASNLGGYNIVRYSFSALESFSISGCSIKYSSDLVFLSAGDFVVFNSFNPDDIPAYGIVKEDKTIDFIFNGDYAENREVLMCCKNVNGNSGVYFDVSMKNGRATSLDLLDANNHKKQVFTVLHDLDYGCKTQYVSYDVNGDGRYEFIYIGVDQNGKDGRSIYAISNDTYESVKNILRVGDLVIVSDAILSIINHKTKVAGATSGDVLEFVSGDEFIFKCSILGPTGPRGQKGEKGEQGIQGVQGVQGIQGMQGIQGEKGKDGDRLDIKSGILSNPSQLPQFSSAEIGDAYRIVNTSGSIVSYDLYFKASNGTDWDIQPNWGGVKGDKGDKGDTGLQGIQGVQGIQGERGESGLTGVVYRFDKAYLQTTGELVNTVFYRMLNTALSEAGIDIKKGVPMKLTHIIRIEIFSCAGENDWSMSPINFKLRKEDFEFVDCSSVYSNIEIIISDGFKFTVRHKYVDENGNFKYETYAMADHVYNLYINDITSWISIPNYRFTNDCTLDVSITICPITYER